MCVANIQLTIGGLQKNSKWPNYIDLRRYVLTSNFRVSQICCDKRNYSIIILHLYY